MPSNRRKPFITPAAEDDLRDLFQYTQETWGQKQRVAYQAFVRRTLRNLAQFPRLGRSRDDISPGLRSYPLGPYLVLYSLRDDGIAIRRIIHGGREIDDRIRQSLQ